MKARQGNGAGGVDLGWLFPIRTPSLPGGRWLLGGVLLCSLLAFFWVCGVFARVPQNESEQGTVGAALFFSVILAYIIPIYGYISERTIAALDALHDVLDASAQRLDGWRSRVRHKPARWLNVVLAIGILSGVAHNLVLSAGEGLGGLGPDPAPGLAIIVGTQLTWIVVTLAVAGLLDNAQLLYRMGTACRVPLFETGRLRPFATVAVISTLALIGAQAAFPILNIEGRSDPLAYIPGLLATGIPMILLAALPVWSVHRRIAAAKRDALAAVSLALAAQPAPDPQQPQSVAAVAPLLAYRRELLQVSEWPFDVGVFTRLGLYLIIPPLTWVGAALIENLVDNLL